MTHPLLDYAASGHVLLGAEAEEIMEELLLGRLETPEIVQFLTALNARPYRTAELAGGDSGIRHRARDGYLHLWEIKWRLFAGQIGGVSPGLFVASIHTHERAFYQ